MEREREKRENASLTSTRARNPRRIASSLLFQRSSRCRDRTRRLRGGVGPDESLCQRKCVCGSMCVGVIVGIEDFLGDTRGFFFLEKMC